MESQKHSVNVSIDAPTLISALLAAGQPITITPQAPFIVGTVEKRASIATPQRQVLNPADLPGLFLDADGDPAECGSSDHVATHFPTAGLIFDVRPWKKVRSLKEAQEVAAQCDLLGRKGEWVIGEDYEVQLMVDRSLHAPAVNKESFPNAPSEGLVYTSRLAAWSSGLVWFVYLSYGCVSWGDVDGEGLAVPVLRVPPSQ